MIIGSWAKTSVTDLHNQDLSNEHSYKEQRKALLKRLTISKIFLVNTLGDLR